MADIFDSQFLFELYLLNTFGLPQDKIAPQFLDIVKAVKDNKIHDINFLKNKIKELYVEIKKYSGLSFDEDKLAGLEADLCQYLVLNSNSLSDQDAFNFCMNKSVLIFSNVFTGCDKVEPDFEKISKLRVDLYIYRSKSKNEELTEENIDHMISLCNESKLLIHESMKKYHDRYKGEYHEGLITEDIKAKIKTQLKENKILFI